MELHICICDDEPIICDTTKEKILTLYPEYQIDVYNSGKELMRCKNQYDVILLDIEMKTENGLEIAEELRKEEYKGYIIFLTSHIEYMARAFKVKAFRYLEKPLMEDEVIEIFQEIKKEKLNEKKILIHHFGVDTLLRVNDIQYIEVKKKTTTLYLKDKSIETSYPLKYWLEKLKTSDFYQTQKSYIVSLKYIEQIEPHQIMLKDGKTVIPLSRRKYQEVKAAFFLYIKKEAKLF